MAQLIAVRSPIRPYTSLEETTSAIGTFVLEGSPPQGTRKEQAYLREETSCVHSIYWKKGGE